MSKRLSSYTRLIPVLILGALMGALLAACGSQPQRPTPDGPRVETTRSPDQSDPDPTPRQASEPVHQADRQPAPDPSRLPATEDQTTPTRVQPVDSPIPAGPTKSEVPEGADSAAPTTAPAEESPVSKAPEPVTVEPATSSKEPVTSPEPEVESPPAANPAPATTAPAATSEPEVDTTVATARVSAHRISGQVELVDPRDSDREGDSREVIAYYIPDSGIQHPLEPGVYQIRTRNKRFEPGVLAVPVGSTIEFPNGDDILHNAFSLSAGNGFDLGLYGLGESRAAVFNEPGLVLVHCNVHHAMQADILVLETPYFAQADDQGRFVIERIPAGKGTIYYWHPRARLKSHPVTVPAGGTLRDSLTVVRPRVPKHRNKFGEPYRPSRD